MTAREVARLVNRRLVVCLTLLIGAACSESARDATAPARQLASPPSLHDVVATSDTGVTVFTIDPTQDGLYPIPGGHFLYVEQGGVCDLASPYGPDYWDTPCTPAATPTVVTAKSYLDALGHPRIDFQPALRFFVQKGRLKTAAILFMHDTLAVRAPHAAILYCDDSGACIDEGLRDKLLQTDENQRSGYLYRQIKHFSGYEVAAGLTSEF